MLGGKMSISPALSHLTLNSVSKMLFTNPFYRQDTSYARAQSQKVIEDIPD